MCRRCNPGNLPSPSPSQYHAVVYVAILATLVLLTAALLILHA